MSSSQFFQGTLNELRFLFDEKEAILSPVEGQGMITLTLEGVCNQVWDGLGREGKDLLAASGDVWATENGIAPNFSSYRSGQSVNPLAAFVIRSGAASELVQASRRRSSRRSEAAHPGRAQEMRRLAAQA